jgi:hypothetical protein
MLFNVALDPQAARRQLERMLARNLFARSEQLSRLLRFLVEQHLDGRDDELKESVIGVEVFGRKTEYNPKFDPIVRTEARRLRARLTEYHKSEGQRDELVIELPKGGYVPVIRAYSRSMPAVELEGAGAVLRELERVLSSPGFARNERISGFLRFVVERHLAGRDDELKESVLGAEVFGRSPDYDPKRDPIVRTEAGRLRSRLIEYYARAGRDDALIVDLPKGGYVPVFHQRGTSHEGDPARQAPDRLAGNHVGAGSRVGGIESLLRCGSS